MRKEQSATFPAICICTYHYTDAGVNPAAAITDVFAGDRLSRAFLGFVEGAVCRTRTFDIFTAVTHIIAALGMGVGEEEEG